MRDTIVHVAVTHMYSGTERVLAELAEEAAHEGNRVAVILPVRPGLDVLAERLSANGVVVERLGNLFAADRDRARSFVEFWKLFRRLRPAVVHFHIPWVLCGWEAVLAARLAGVPAVVRTEQNPIPGPLPRLQRLKLRIADLAAHHSVFVSKRNRQSHLAHGRSWLRRSSVIPNGIAPAPAPLGRAAARECLGLPAEAPVAAMVGHLEPRKGPLDFVRAAALAIAEGSGLHFVVFGDGPLRAEAERLAQALGVAARVHFAGHRGDVRALLPALDIYVQPSHFEGLSIAMLEALAAGLPMVSTRVEGLDEVLDGAGGALVCEVGDIAGLAAALVRLEGDRALRAELARETQARVLEKFSSETMTGRYRLLYERLGVPLPGRKGEEHGRPIGGLRRGAAAERP